MPSANGHVALASTNTDLDFSEVRLMTVHPRSPSRRASLARILRRLGLSTLSLAALSLQSNSAQAIDLANSMTGWSTSGVQGENDWLYGIRNVTADGGGAYDFATDFVPFQNDGSNVLGPTNQWNGSFWKITNSPPPWTEILQENVHPNSVGNGGEHWAIRRWVANSVTEPTEVALEWHMRKTNVSCGDGVGGLLFANGVQVDSATIAFNNSAGVTRTAIATINPGDVVDLALTPNTPNNDGCDGSAFRLRAYEAPHADSLLEWSTTGTQGQNNWFNGYFRLTGDANGQYDTDDFIPFLSDGTNVRSATNHWGGSDYRLVNSGSPWTNLGQEANHPLGTNSSIAGGTPPNQEHWTIRRWVADVDSITPLALQWHMRKQANAGTGVEGKLFINGVEVDGQAIAGSNTSGINRTYYANVNPGDLIELALGPTGPTGDRTDGSDGSFNRLSISKDIPVGARQPATIKLADSIADWSTTGTQGERGWFNGYYDVRADAVTNGGNGQYEVGDLVPFLNDGSNVIVAPSPAWTSSPNHWSGSAWDLVVNGPPWTQVARDSGHPAATVNNPANPIHWAVRRWVSDYDGEVEIQGLMHRPTVGADGTRGRLFIDGVEVWNGHSEGAVVNFALFATVSNGSVIDFAIDSDGANVYDELTGSGLDLINDGSDTTFFNFAVYQPGATFEPVPEPSSIVLGVFGVAGLGIAVRRRRR
jgi:hypothetical protein